MPELRTLLLLFGSVVLYTSSNSLLQNWWSGRESPERSPDEECGVPAIPPALDQADYVVGGQVAVPGSWPWQVQLCSVLDGHICGGALIGHQHVATAAHCVWGENPRLLRVYLGSHQLSARDGTEVVAEIDDICIRPGYDSRLQSGTMPDIAIIKLRHKVNMTTTIQPVCLPHSGEELPMGSSVYVTGWGSTRELGGPMATELKQARIKVVPTGECKKSRNSNILPTVFCGEPDNGAACRGDSGGPVVHLADGRWTLHGIVSGGPKICGSSSVPQYFTKVSSYVRDFIAPYTDSNLQAEAARNICATFHAG